MADRSDAVWREACALADFPPAPVRRIEASDVFVHRVTWIMALLAVGYGLLTFVVGEPLWGPPSGEDELYASAMTVPGAPQTWGALAAFAGVLIGVGQWRRRHGVVRAGCFLLSVWLLFFAITFVADSHGGLAMALPPALVYALLAVLVAARADLASQWRRHGET